MKYLALGIAIACFTIAILYLFGIIGWFADPAHHRHYSHFALFAVLGILALIWMRFAARANI